MEKGLSSHSAKLSILATRKLSCSAPGGAGRAIAVETALAGASQFTIVNRNPERGQALAELMKAKVLSNTKFVVWDHNYEVPSDTDVVINATSIGLFPDVNAKLNINFQRSPAVDGCLRCDSQSHPKLTSSEPLKT